MCELPGGRGELVYEDRVPVAWHPLEPDPGPGAVGRTYEAALTRLNALLSLGETPPPPDAIEEGPARAQELVRLEARLNLLLTLVGEILTGQRPPPPSRAVRLAAHWVEWEEPAPPATGDLIAIGLYLNPTVPDAVNLPARVEGLAVGSDGLARVRAAFWDLPAAVESALEKLIFRSHRRRVAEQRKAHRPL